MPPFRAGLLKRKLDTKKIQPIKESSDDETSGSDETAVLLPGELNLDGDDTDSEDEEEVTADSDHEQDEVLYGDDADSTLGEDEEEPTGDGSDQSSDLTDSEADDDSEDDGDDDDNVNESDQETSEGVSSEAESGIGQTHSSGSESEKKTNRKPKQKLKKGKSVNSKEDTTSSIDRLADSIKNTKVTTEPVGQKDEYESGDTSDEEERQNTVGDIPMWWYNEYPHVGYNLDGQKIMKPPQRDQIDEFLKKCEDPEFWRTVRDPTTGQDVVLSAPDLELLRRLRAGLAPSAEPDDQPWVEWFSGTVLAAPVRAFPEHKRSFLPSRGEQAAVARLVHALRMGWLATRRQLAAARRRRRERRFYDLWGAAPAPLAPPARAPAPRRAPPAHAESYNPPPEYLLDAAEMKEWESLRETPWKRKYTFLPRRHASLRAVPAYERFARERFLRCLDLYLAPRAIKMRLTLRPEELVPALPAPRELRPFPTQEALAMRGHAGLVRCAAFEPSGQHLVSGGEDGTLRVWETASGRCVRTVHLGEPVASVAWVPAGGLRLVAAAAGARLLLLAPGGGASRAAERTDALLAAGEAAPPPDARTRAACTWDAVAATEWERGVRLAVTHFRPVAHVAWHARGDYLCVTLRDAASRAVVVHQLSRRRSQLPFARAQGLVQCALFHPTKPTLFVATQRAVREYDLVKQERLRTLRPGAQWVSCLAMHPRGDHLLVGTYDRKLAWFDLELSARPYRSLRLHAGAVRSVAFHSRYPLFASGGDDPRLVVSHATVYSDLLQNPLLVPLKQLAGGARREALCVLHVAWHPTQPWLLAACADGTLRLYS